MNERQQRAQAQIMSVISALPWTERARVVRAVNRNDEICLKCGRVTERWGDCQCVPLPPDVTITHVQGHECDRWVSWGQWRELPNYTENDKRIHAFKCEDGRVWDAVNGWRREARADSRIDGSGWAEAAFCDDVDPAQREPWIMGKWTTGPQGWPVPVCDAELARG